MLYKYHPPAIISRPTVKSMPQLDFREALSTPEEKHFSPVPAAAVPAAIPAPRRFDFLARGFRLTRSTWANIIFVTIASAGGLFCAFYFFNGAEVLRAAASWPNEFLYPRPSSTDVINAAVQPNPVDTFSDTTATNSKSSSSSSAAKGPFDQKVWPTDLSQPPIVTSPLTAPGVFTDSGVVLVPSGPGSTIFSRIDSTIQGLNLLPPGGDALFQSLYQTAVSSTASTVKTTKKTGRSTLSSTRRKVSSTGQKLTSVTQSSASSASSMVKTTTQN